MTAALVGTVTRPVIVGLLAGAPLDAGLGVVVLSFVAGARTVRSVELKRAKELCSVDAAASPRQFEWPTPIAFRHERQR